MDVNLILMRKSIINPKVNSAAVMQNAQSIESGCRKLIPKEVKYWSNVMLVATGSTALVKPEYKNTQANKIRMIFTQICSFLLFIVRLFNKLMSDKISSCRILPFQ